MVTPSYAFRLSQHGLELDSAGHHNLDDMTDVDLTVAPALNDVLTWNGTSWVAQAGGGGGGTPTLNAVLTAGNDTGGLAIVSNDPGATSPPTLQISSHVSIAGGDFGAGDPGGYVDLTGGLGDAGAGGADLTVGGGELDSTGGGIWLTSGDAKAASNKPAGDIHITRGVGDGTGRNGLIILTGLPTTDPGVSGALWNNSGAIKISP